MVQVGILDPDGEISHISFRADYSMSLLVNNDHQRCIIPYLISYRTGVSNLMISYGENVNHELNSARRSRFDE